MLFRKLQPVRIETEEGRKNRRPPEPEERSLREALDDAASGLTAAWRRNVRNVLDEVIRDLKVMTEAASDQSLASLYREVEHSLSDLRAEVIDGGIGGVRKAFSVASRFAGYSEGTTEQKQLMINTFAANLRIA